MQSELVAKLRGLCIDWTGEPIVDGSTPRIEPDCATLREAAAAIERLAAERDEALKAAEGLEPRIKHMRFEDGQFDMALTGQTVEAIAVAFVSHFKSLGAENYVELNIFDRAEPFQRYTVTVQKVGALSPADKVKAAEAQRDKLKEALTELVNAKAIGGVREIVAGWNGENRPDGPYERHPAQLGATLPKTDCGSVYELDEAMQRARQALGDT